MLGVQGPTLRMVDVAGGVSAEKERHIQLYTENNVSHLCGECVGEEEP